MLWSGIWETERGRGRNLRYPFYRGENCDSEKLRILPSSIIVEPVSPQECLTPESVLLTTTCAGASSRDLPDENHVLLSVAFSCWKLTVSLATMSGQILFFFVNKNFPK